MENKQTDKVLDNILSTTNFDEIEERLKEINVRTTAFVKKNPLTSIALAAAVGFILGRIFSGRRS